MKKLIFILSIFFLISCGESETKLKQNIGELEDEIYNTTAFDASKTESLLELYIKFTDKFPQNADAPEYLMKAGDLAMRLNKGELAIEYFTRLGEEYPNDAKAPQSVFLKGFVYENLLGDLDKARSQYEIYISKYPNDVMIESAYFLLENLGKTDEELILMLQQKEEEETVN
jgi:outer membrane protein assembly factor BamD (BamD/ComL family)